VTKNGSQIDLGPCCMCSGPNAINILMLPQRAPIPGTGWGCVVCGLDADGAIAVLCPDCFELHQENPNLLGFCCSGYARAGVRVAIADLPDGVFDHDRAKHTDEEALPW
jgi:hypothetical protein